MSQEQAPRAVENVRQEPAPEAVENERQEPQQEDVENAQQQSAREVENAPQQPLEEVVQNAQQQPQPARVTEQEAAQIAMDHHRTKTSIGIRQREPRADTSTNYSKEKRSHVQPGEF